MAARRSVGLKLDPGSGTCVIGGGFGVRGRPPPRLARGVCRRPGGSRADRRRRNLAARRRRGSGPAVASGRVPGRGAGVGQDVRRRRPVRGGRGGNGPRPLRISAPAAASVRDCRRDHRGAEPGRHRRAADTSGADHGSAAARTGASTCLCDGTPGQRGLVTASGVQPDQPAGVSRRQFVLHQVHRGDGAAVAGRGGHGVPGLPGVLSPGSQRAARSPRGSAGAADTGVRVGRGGADAGRDS